MQKNEVREGAAAGEGEHKRPMHTHQQQTNVGTGEKVGGTLYVMRVADRESLVSLRFDNRSLCLGPKRSHVKRVPQPVMVPRAQVLSRKGQAYMQPEAYVL